MNPQEIEKLLGGYATDTLTEEERRNLFTAALENQALFDALADEQALRELLQDPASRAQLLAALRQEHGPLRARLAAWLRQPSVLALAAAVTAGIVIIALVIPRKTATERPAMVAMSRPAEPMPSLETKVAPETAAPAPKPAPPAPTGSLQKDVGPQRQRPERDLFAPQNIPTATNTVATSPPPSPPPQPSAAPPVVVAPAQSQFKATEDVQVQSAAPRLADSKSPAAPGTAPQEARKEAAQVGARELYDSTQAGVAGGTVPRAKTAKAKQGFGRALSMRGAAATPPAPAVFAVRYSILRRNPDGSFAEVDPSTIFAPGDALRVRFETNQPGNLAVMERQASGLWTQRLAARMQPGEPVYMPAETTLNVTAARGYRFFVRFSRSPRSDSNLDQIAQTPNLARETVANWVYVANPVAATDPAVDFEFAINAK